MTFLAFLPLIGQVLERVLPDPKAADEAKMKLLELTQKADSQELDAALQVALGQLAVNKAEAGTGSLFIGGWRPAIGWVCALSLFSYYVPYTLAATLLWSVQVWQSGVLSPRPDLGIADLLGLVGAMLGVAGMRSFERVRGVIPPQK